MTALTDALLRGGVRLTESTPAPDIGFTGDPNLVTPGVLGFIAILFVGVAALLLIVDMNKRIRRSRYREEVRLMLEAERVAALAEEGATSGDPEVATSPSAGESETPDSAPPA